MTCAKTINLGVMAPRGHEQAKKKWQELGVYLWIGTGEKTKIIPLAPDEVEKAIKEGRINYLLSNPVIAVTIRKNYGWTPIATLNRLSGAHFAGVIIARKGANIATIDDLKGKRALGFKFKRSAAAYVFQVKHLRDRGFDPHKDFASFEQAKNQDEIVMAVKSGAVDVGFIKSGLLEAMEKEGKIHLSDFVIIDQQRDNFVHVHSTALYPEWTVTAGKENDPKVTEKLTKALLKLPRTDRASKHAGIVGFVQPQNLDRLAETLKALKLPPFSP